MTHDPVPPADGALPRARVVAARRRGFPLLLPLVAGAVALFLAIHAWMGGGPEITVRAAAGHGVGVGDPLRYRGVTVGEVRRVALAADREHVDLVLALEPGAESLCREQSRFWIVRPHLTLDSVQGLETVVGARYLAVLPGPLDGPERYDFDALAEPPVPVEVRAEGLELELEAASREGLVPGAEVRYRGVPVGTVLSADLAGDASSVVVRAYVEPEYAQLVRANSYFWSSGGLELRAGLTSGVRLELESLRALLVGGISFATPSDAGALATDGTRFVLHREPHEDAASWRPALLVGAEPLAPAAAELVALPVRLEWRSGLFKSKHERAGWAVALPGALLAPADLLAAPDDAKAGSVALTVDGARFELAAPPSWQAGALAVRRLDHGRAAPGTEALRAPEAPEDCVVRAGADAPQRALDAARLTAVDGTWRVDAGLALEPALHGAAVFARRDGRCIGVLSVHEDGAEVLPLGAPEAFARD